ncbi:MAG: hypothetical protein Fur0023_07340 [Bacteroidia bacterium]
MGKINDSAKMKVSAKNTATLHSPTVIRNVSLRSALIKRQKFRKIFQYILFHDVLHNIGIFWSFPAVKIQTGAGAEKAPHVGKQLEDMMK